MQVTAGSVNLGSVGVGDDVKVNVAVGVGEQVTCTGVAKSADDVLDLVEVLLGVIVWVQVTLGVGLQVTLTVFVYVLV